MARLVAHSLLPAPHCRVHTYLWAQAIPCSLLPCPDSALVHEMLTTQTDQLGDLSTLLDPSVVEALKEKVAALNA